MIRIINHSPPGMYIPDGDTYIKVELARGLAFGSKFIGFFFFGDEWIFTICEVELFSGGDA